MPSGKTHDKIAFISIIPILLIGLKFFGADLKSLLLYCLTSFFSQIMLSPDLDVNSSQHKRWGILKFLWFPYRLFFKHRSSFSHGMIFGPILKITYIICVIAFLYFSFCLFIEYNYNISLLPYFIKSIKSVIHKDMFYYYSPIIAGVFTGSTVHTLSDKFFSFFKGLL